MAQVIRFRIAADDAESLEEKRKQVIKDLKAVGAYARVEPKITPDNKARSHSDYIIVSRGKNEEWDPIMMAS